MVDRIISKYPFRSFQQLEGTYHLRAVSSPADAAMSKCIISWLATSYLFFVGSTNDVGLADSSPVT